ncbi:MAG TPA: CopD family protein [Kribbellaceae bacterium]|nr:CopD family protein [Kribbellaceae bacterium]
MSEATLAIALSAIRIITYTGFVLAAGTLVFLSIVWPQGRRIRRLILLIAAGIALLAVGTVAGPLVEAAAYDVSIGDAVGRLSGAAALVRLAVLVGLAMYLPDLVRRDIHRWRTFVALTAVLVIEATLVLQSDAVGGRWEIVKVIAAMGHLTAVAVWLGGLVALAVVLIPGRRLGDLHSILPTFSTLATVSVVTLLVTGVVHAVAVAGGIDPLFSGSYGVALGVKAAVFALLLGVGDRGRQYASRLARRPLDEFDDTAAPAGVQALAVSIGAELALAAAVLVATAVLVWFAPCVSC